ncbi:dipeptide epimerase [Christiangramia sabulilitoris]|uniref:Dipeptide epimerase n=1 Tax=Christiangramia sabulilitoris TaxID=2583991 RepID=A0A550I8V6_9FLAO|nr:dipeptide epimerase [Christiangramia sabulilitoris]TRO67405.1 dipeptide epimerase [Christiangramia sabulilitoris]
MKIHFKQFDLQLRDTFKISHSSRDYQPTLILGLEDGKFTGYGEAAATNYYGITVNKMIAAIQRVSHIVEQNIHRTPEELWELTFPHLKNDLFAQCALDMALHDLHGKRKGLPLYKLWQLDHTRIPVTNYTIGLDSVEKMIQKINDFPWPIYKIKLGTPDDIRIIKELRKFTNAVFRVDANASWKVEETIKNSGELKRLNVEFIEQPLDPEDIEGLQKVYNNSVLPLIADESCIREENVEKCANYFHGVNIKLTKCGGITPARRMISKARDLGLKVMIGCMTESSVGISAIAHLAPSLDYVDMDGAMLLKKDIAEGVKITKEKVIFPDRNGMGVILIDDQKNIENADKI